MDLKSAIMEAKQAGRWAQDKAGGAADATMDAARNIQDAWSQMGADDRMDFMMRAAPLTGGAMVGLDFLHGELPLKEAMIYGGLGLIGLGGVGLARNAPKLLKSEKTIKRVVQTGEPGFRSVKKTKQFNQAVEALVDQGWRYDDAAEAVARGMQKKALAGTLKSGAAIYGGGALAEAGQPDD